MSEPLGGTPPFQFEPEAQEYTTIILSSIDGRTRNVVGKILHEATEEAEMPTINQGILEFNVKYKSETSVIRISVPLDDVVELLHIQVADVSKCIEEQTFEEVVATKLEAESLEFKEAGLSFDDMRTLSIFYEIKKDELEQQQAPAFISRKEPQDPPLPRSLVYNPEERGRGLYILLKMHGGIEEVGRGGHHTVTLAIHLDTGAFVTWRTARAIDVSVYEITANEEARLFPENFVAGFAVRYKGPWRDRVDKSKAYQREQNVDKIGFITEFCQRGDLLSLIEKQQQIPTATAQKLQITQKLQAHPEDAETLNLELAASDENLKSLQDPLLAPLEKLRLACEFVENLAVLHDELRRVHRDLKPENIYITLDGRLKIGDFGYCRSIGEEARKMEGSPGYFPPEVIQAILNKETYIITPFIDLWSAGCVLADLLVGPKWVHWTGQVQGQWDKILNEHELRIAKRAMFENWENTMHPDYYIYRLLSFDPGARPSAKAVAKGLRAIYNELSPT